MPTCILDDIAIIHTPKTGGEWIAEVLRQLDIPFGALPEKHTQLHEVRRLYPRHRTVAFVRNPATWWQSYWGYRMATHWVPMHDVDEYCRDDNFRSFMEKVLCICRFHCGQIFDAFAGTPEAPADFIGRFENLASDLVRALAPTYEIDLEQVAAIPPINCSRHTSSSIYSTDLLLRLYRSEERTFLRYGYSIAEIDTLPNDPRPSSHFEMIERVDGKYSGDVRVR